MAEVAPRTALKEPRALEVGVDGSRPTPSGEGRGAVAQTPSFASEDDEEGQAAREGQQGEGSGDDDGAAGADGADESVGLKRKLAFDEEEARIKKEGAAPGGFPAPAQSAAHEEVVEKETPVDRPRTSRTTATKVSEALLKKIVSNQSGWDLKITGLVTYDQLARLTQALAGNESTERLDLEGCAIGDNGCALIRDLLMSSNRIKHVDLQMNQISDVGCKSLAEGIPGNRGLQRLYLGYNSIRDEGVMALIDAMQPGRRVEIHVTGNTQVSEHALAKLDDALGKLWAPARGKPAAPAMRIVAPPTRPSEAASGARTRANTGSSPQKGENGGEEGAGGGGKRPRNEERQQGGKARGGGVRREREEEIYEGELVGVDTYRGVPLTYSFTESAQPAARGPPSTPGSDGRDAKGLERELFEARCRLQWARVRQSLADQLAKETQELSIGKQRKSMFMSACKYVLGQQALRHVVADKSGATRAFLACEEDRRDEAEDRVRALLDRFREIVEQTAQRQRAEAQILAAAHGTLVARGELPAGQTADPGVVHVPCPFRLAITVRGHDAASDTTLFV